jgi:hypothetical protein
VASWTEEDLKLFGTTDELQLASLRKDGSLRPFVTMWVVRVQSDLYVRSAHGPENPWYRRALASGSGRIRARGAERDVSFTEAAPAVHPDIDAAYHAKYDRYGPRIVGSVVGPQAAAVTISLLTASQA